jgi:hypothetical protein
MVKMTVDRIGSQVLVRRDTWLTAVNKSVPRTEKLKLREADLNGKFLFGADLVEKAKSSVADEVRDKVHEKFLKTSLTTGESNSSLGEREVIRIISEGCLS